MTIQRYIELQRWDGTRLVLHQIGRAAPYKVLRGATGLDAPPMHYTWESAPGVPGDRLAGLALAGAAAAGASIGGGSSGVAPVTNTYSMPITHTGGNPREIEDAVRRVIRRIDFEQGKGRRA